MWATFGDKSLVVLGLKESKRKAIDFGGRYCYAHPLGFVCSFFPTNNPPPARSCKRTLSRSWIEFPSGGCDVWSLVKLGPEPLVGEF